MKNSRVSTKLMLIALLCSGCVVRSEDPYAHVMRASDPYTEKVVEEYVKPAAKVGFWALVGYLGISITF